MPQAMSVLLGYGLSTPAGPAGRCAPSGPFAARWAGCAAALVAAARVGPAGLVLAQAVLFLFLVLFFYQKQGTCKIRNKS